MARNIKKEVDLYPDMCVWLQEYLGDKYRGKKCIVKVIDSHSQYLDSVLEANGVIKHYPQVIGVKIEIDVLGIVILENSVNLYFIEAKNRLLRSSIWDNF